MTMTMTNDIEIYDNKHHAIKELLAKITLKKFKHYEGMSQETNAFTAELHVDGQLCGVVENDGHGGMTCVQFTNSAGKHVATHLERKAQVLTAYAGERQDGTTFTGQWDLEMLIDEKVEQLAQAKWVQVKSRTQVLVETSDGKTFSYKRHKKVSDKQATAAEETIIIEAIKRQNDNWTRIYCLRSIEGGEIIRD
jgi:hypothetical protein